MLKFSLTSLNNKKWELFYTLNISKNKFFWESSRNKIFKLKQTLPFVNFLKKQYDLAFLKQYNFDLIPYLHKTTLNDDLIILESSNFIKIEFVQKNIKNIFIQMYNSDNQTLKYWSKKRLKDNYMFLIFYSMFVALYLTVYTVNLILQYTAKHSRYVNTFLKFIEPYSRALSDLKTKFNVILVITKPNSFSINFQKKKFGSIKKSRKKLIYLFLPVFKKKTN